jgi:hypothetical protein
MLSPAFELARLDIPKGICQCGEMEPTTMTGQGCYECSRKHRGFPILERHHVFLIAIQPDTVVLLPGNFHRMLSRRQEVCWPVLRAPSTDPLIKAAQTQTRAAEFLEVLSRRSKVMQLPGWVAEMADIIARECRADADTLLVISAKNEELANG